MASKPPILPRTFGQDMLLLVAILALMLGLAIIQDTERPAESPLTASKTSPP